MFLKMEMPLIMILFVFGSTLVLIGVCLCPVQYAFAGIDSGLLPTPPPNQCDRNKCYDCWFNTSTKKCEGACNTGVTDCKDCLCKQYTVGDYSQCYCLK